MKLLKKALAMLLVVFSVIGLMSVLKPYVEAGAASKIGKPTIKIKKINSKTGVKITINKTKGAAGFYLYMSSADNEYSKYLFNNGKVDRLIAHIEQDGSKARTYTIKGLPKGTYKFKAIAYNDDDFIEGAAKSVTVKAGKKKAVKDKSYDFSKVSVGDTIKFGTYEQDDNMKNGKEAIEWIVLSKGEKQMMVISKYVLDCLPYHTTAEGDITWEDCSLRKWLNDSFYSTAFTKTEKSLINTAKVKNSDNFDYEIPGGNDTKDKVFLLSIDEGLNISTDILLTGPTAYAEVQGVYHHNETEETAFGVSACMYYLRSPGYASNDAAVIDEWGVNTCGDIVTNGDSTTVAGDIIYINFGVRPVMYINIEEK